METLFWTLAAVLTVASGQVEHSVCEVSRITLNTFTKALLYSPSSGDNVSSTSTCTVRLANGEYNHRIIQLNVTSFSLGGREPCSVNQEYLQISFPYSGRGDVDTIRWCGQSYTPLLETHQVMDITYFPGPQTERGRGFNITITTDLKFRCQERNLMVGDQPMFLYSPGYPASVNSHEWNWDSCLWTIVSKDNSFLLVDTLHFSLQTPHFSNANGVWINAARYFGDQRVRFTSKRNLLVLQYYPAYNNEDDVFVFQFNESPSSSVASCGTEVVADNVPLLLQLPIIDYSGTNNTDCWWLVDSGSDDSVVLLEMNKYISTTPCSDFDINIYDGMNGTSENRILLNCSMHPMFHTIRSSSRYLFINASLSSIVQSQVNMSFTYSSSRRDSPPRLFYADFRTSYVWLDLDAGLDLGLLIQGAEESVGNYSTCVELSVTTFHTEFTKINASEVIYAFSGWNESFAELTTACGRPDSERILSRGSKLFIKLRENRPPSLRYVWLVYRLLRNCKPDIVWLQSEYMTPQTLQSDFSLQKVNSTFRPTNHYPNNVYCRWLIVPQYSGDFIRIHVQNSSLYNFHDSVGAYDYQSGSGDTSHLLSWTRSATPSILSSRGHSLLLEFFTNEEFTDAGFTIDYSSIKHLSELGYCPSMATLTAEDYNQFLSTPEFPYNYPSNVDCKWRITSYTGVVELTLLSPSNAQESRGCLYGSLVIYDGSYASGRALANLCGHSQTHRTYNSSSDSLLVYYHTDLPGTSNGFRLQYKTSTNSEYWHCNRSIYVTANEDPEVTSPFYPNPFPRNVNCYWLVRNLVTYTVLLEVVTLDVPCSSPVLLYDGVSNNSRVLAQVCSDNYQTQYRSSQQSMYITFRATFSYGSRGFRFRLRSWEDNIACQGQIENLMAYRYKQYITSPGYPGQYPSHSNCQWLIESAYMNMSVYVEIEDAKIEYSTNCHFDNITFYDGYGKGSPQLGKLCGEKQVSYTSQGIYMFVSFITDSYSEYRGFRMAYWVGPPPTSSQDDSTTTAKIIGGVIAGVFFVVAGITAYLCFTGRCRRGQAHSQHQPSQQRSLSEQVSTAHDMSPAIVNGSFMADDLPPAYNTVNASLQQPPPPSYRELDALPPYTDAMKESYPPSNPSPSPGGREGGGDDSTNHDHQSLSPEVSGPAHHQRQSSDHDYDTLSDATMMNNVDDEQQSVRSTYL